jgi:hypothetical protein
MLQSIFLYVKRLRFNMSPDEVQLPQTNTIVLSDIFK